ncbi:hypothetical protein LRY65_01420 [Candidatus Woesebacteria bacterium]|nr:hypothetical protein [Candidatus Woesebacteria bacterium]
MTGANRERALVVKFGGSEATDENGVCEENLHAWFEAVQVHFPTHFVHAVFAIGGGQHVRKEQASQGDISDERKDQIGIEVLRGHAEQVQRVLARQGYSVESEIPQSPADAQTILSEQRQFAVALGGLQVGQSTDASAVTAAEIYQDNGYDASILILSNIWNIFTADPRKDDSARPISASSLATLVAEGVLLNDPCQFRPA